MIELVEFYDNWLAKLEVNPEEYYRPDGVYHASGAGLCIKKIIGQSLGFNTSKKDKESLRFLRLGKLIGEDFQKAVAAMIIEDPAIELLIEETFEDTELNIKGRIDIGIHHLDDYSIDILDTKAIKDYQYGLKLGTNKKMQKKGYSKSTNYEQQLGTYGLMSNNTYDIKNGIDLALVYYNRDTSAVAQIPVDPEWIEDARDYWRDVNVHANGINNETNWNKILPKGVLGCPQYKWECNSKYCVLHDKCL
ncbi:hypothetical protein ACFL4H_00225 [Candidatus Neomarinimicrobiota bacterium]